MVVASTLAPALARRVEHTGDEYVAPAGHVLVVLDGATPAGPLVKLAGRLAEPDGGRVSALLVVGTGQPRPPDSELERLGRQLSAVGIDTQLLVRVDDTTAEGVLHTAHAEHATLLVIPAGACDSSLGTPTVVVGRTGLDGIETHDVPGAITARLVALGLVAPAR